MVWFQLWAPRFGYILSQQSYPNLDEPVNEEIIKRFQMHSVHKAFEVCATLRPSVDIAVLQ